MDIHAVGNQFFRRQSYNWKILQTPDSLARYSSISGTLGGPVIAVGGVMDEGRAAIYDGIQWQPMPLPAGAPRLNDVFVLSDTLAYAVAWFNVYRYDGAAWERLPLDDTIPYDCLWANGPDDIFASAWTGVYKFENGHFMWLSLPQNPTGLDAVTGSSSESSYRVYANDINGNVYVIDPSGTTVRTLPSVGQINNAHLWAAPGLNPPVYLQEDRHIFRWDPRTQRWDDTELPVSGFIDCIFGLPNGRVYTTDGRRIFVATDPSIIP